MSLRLSGSIFPVYPSPLRHWDARSWIRSKPTRALASLEGLPFPVRLVPIASHPKIKHSKTLQAKVLAYRLLAHLRFTTLLELEHVNPVCSDLGRGISKISLSEGQRNDALRIYCDEGGHALFVELLAKDIEAYYGVSASALGLPAFHQNMKAMLAQPHKNIDSQLLQHFFVSVSETLVTKILKDIPHDPDVAPLVREVIGDHANDEAAHSIYFRWYFPKLWQAISKAEKKAVAATLADLVWTFLSPDLEVEKRVLKAIGFSAKESAQILREVYDEKSIVESVQQAAKPTLEMFEQAGVFDETGIREQFIVKRLLIAR